MCYELEELLNARIASLPSTTEAEHRHSVLIKSAVRVTGFVDHLRVLSEAETDRHAGPAYGQLARPHQRQAALD